MQSDKPKALGELTAAERDASSAGVHERIGVYRTAHDLVPKIERQEFFVNMVAVVALYFLEVIRVITDVLCPAMLSSTTK